MTLHRLPSGFTFNDEHIAWVERYPRAVCITWREKTHARTWIRADAPTLMERASEPRGALPFPVEVERVDSVDFAVMCAFLRGGAVACACCGVSMRDCQCGVSDAD